MSYLNERIALTILCSCFLPSAMGAQEPLRLTEAEALAIERDMGREALAGREQAQRERAVAAGQWPDPQLRFGLSNLPVDSFALSQEPMTQAIVGLRQPISTRSLRDARAEGMRAMASVFGAEQALRERRIRRAVRELWLELAYWQGTEATILETRTLFGSLVEVTRSAYRVGRTDQQDVLRAELELERLQDRAMYAAQRSAELRAELSAWVGPGAFGPLALQLDGAREGPGPVREALIERIDAHPEVVVQVAQIDVAQAALGVAEARYSPSWTLDLSYGFRSGLNDDGSDRSDFASVMVSLDLPIFGSDRQDREHAAAESERAAAHAARVDVSRRLIADLDAALASWQHSSDRLQLYDATLVQRSELQAQAALNAYRSDVGDFADLMLATVGVLEARLERLRLAVDRQRALAAIDYLGGSSDA